MGREEDYIDSYKNEEDRINSEYQLAKDRNYIQLRDKQIQLQNAKQNALRSSNLLQSNMGFNTQGYGSSLHTGIYNNYLNAFNQANIEAENRNAELEQNQRNDLTQARTNQVNTVLDNMENARNADSYNEYLKNLGYGQYDENGDFALSENAPSNMSKQQWEDFKLAYDNMFGESQEDKLAYDSSTLPNASYIKANGTTGTLGADFKYETENLLTRAGQGEYKVGDTFKLKNTSGDSIYLKFGKNGFSMINEAEFKESGNKAHYINWNLGDSDKYMSSKDYEQYTKQMDSLINDIATNKSPDSLGASNIRNLKEYYKENPNAFSEQVLKILKVRYNVTL